MKKYTGLITIAIIAAVIIILTAVVGGAYNNIVVLQEKVKKEESSIDIALERRADLIPNLVSTVKGYAAHEEKVIKEITNARENLLKADSIEEKGAANDKLTNAIDALMVIVENYPDLKANTNFIKLQDELAGTENRIAVTRRDYNDAAEAYNATIKKFPNNILAKIFGFKDATYFEVSEGKTEVPEVNFE